MTTLPAPVHLLCLIHGMWGSPVHLSEAARVIQDKYETARLERGEGQCELDVLRVQTNREASTYDGIDWGGERIADEIQQHVSELEADNKKKVTKLSILGYSLGGLLGRYVIGVLHSRKFFENVTPVNFTTIATPHIGLPRYPSFLSAASNLLGPTLLSRTGGQFFAVDKWSASGRPLLQVMADPDRIFLKALNLFSNLTIYANAINDRTVPYVTAGIEAIDPFFDYPSSGIEIKFDEQYNPIVASYTVPDVPPPRSRPKVFSGAWWKSIEVPKPPIPPFLQFRFPFNVLVYLAVPILLPTLICMVLVRLSLDARASRARIKILESSDSSESGQSRLITLLRTLEKEVDDAVADIIDDTSPSPEPRSTSNSGTSTPTLAPISTPMTTPLVHKKHPKLKPVQLQMIQTLNANLPHLKKKLAFIHPVRNAHAVIISRDVKRFAWHKKGEGVLRHWADGFAF